MKKYSFDDHPEHKLLLDSHAKQWIDIALRTRPQDDNDREAVTTAMGGMYGAAKLPPAQNEVFCPSPISAAIAAGIAAGVWWIRENQLLHKDMFGRSINEDDIRRSIMAAIAAIIKIGLAPQPYDATRDATYAATYAATFASTYASTYAATFAATFAATDASTYAATFAATQAATFAATDASTFDATSAATTGATRGVTRLVTFLMGCAQRWSSMRNGGNQWAGWCSYLSFFREVANLGLPQYNAWIHYENAARHGGPRFTHAKFWIVSDFPTVICRDDQNRPHCATGPSIAWSDGWAAYYWHGTKVPREWIMDPKSIDASVALTHPNAELRRCAAEIIGWDTILTDLNAKTIDTDRDPMIGQLVEATVEGERERFLRAKCATGRKFAIPVPPDTKTAIAAQAWIHDLPESTIRALEVRT